MNRPYVPGIWAERYSKLSTARKHAVNREVDRILTELTGFTGKLDPARDKELVRAWLLIRDGVMSGDVKAQARLFFRMDGMRGSSTDPRHRGWFDVVRVGSTVIGPPTTISSSSGGGGSSPGPNHSLDLWFHENQNIAPLLALGEIRSTASLKISSPGMVVTWNMTMVKIINVKHVRPHIGVSLVHSGMKFVFD